MSGGARPKRIGEFMMEKGLLHREWINPIIKYSKENGMRFGEAAVALGYVTENQLRDVLAQPYKKQVIFHLNPQFFPRVTQDLIPLDVVVRYGILPLGVKNEWKWFRAEPRLNLGVLNIERQDGVEWVRSRAENVNSFKTFQVLPDEFLQTLDLCYGVGRAAMMEKKADQIDMNLSLYLQLERRKRPRTE